MLSIKRVPTVVSNYQSDVPDDSITKSQGCGRNCLGQCCLPVSCLPVFAFKNDEERGHAAKEYTSYEESEVSFLSDLLLGQWEERMSKGLFQYDVTACETKIIPGIFGFIAQLNEGRHLKKRPTQFRIDQVLQPFDENKFNFTKIGQEEVLFRFEPNHECNSFYLHSTQIDAHPGSPTVLAINVSPIEYGHVLLIPRVLDLLPQRIDRDSFFLAMCLAKEADEPFFRVGYNSLGAFATINHLHFQAYYLQVPFPVEKAQTFKIMRKQKCGTEVIVSQLLNYPVKALVFEGGSTMRDLSDAVSNSCISLQNNNIPFNILISECGKKVFLFPQCFAEKQAHGQVDQEILETMVNPAIWEISGHMVLKRREDYDNVSEDYACKLLSEVSLSEERFEEVKGYVSQAAGFIPHGPF